MESMILMYCIHGNVIGKYIVKYGKCSKISNTFLSLFSNKIKVFSTGIQNHYRIINRADPYQTASSSGSALFV